MKERKIKHIVLRDGKKIVTKPDFKDLHKVTSAKYLANACNTWNFLKFGMFFKLISITQLCSTLEIKDALNHTT